MRALYTRYGDPGDVAYHAVIDTSSGARTSVLRPHPPLLIQSLYRDLHKIASAKGQGSQKTRQAITDKLMLSAVGSSWTTTGKTDLAANRNAHLLGEEARYLVRTLAQNLRVGAVRTTILNALAKAFVLSPPPAVLSLPADDRTLSISSDDLRCIASQKQDQSPLSPVRKGKAKIGQSEAYKEAHERVQATLKRAEALLRQAYAQHPSYDDLVAALLRGGIDTVIEPTHPIGLTIGVPLMPALGEPTRSLDEIYERLGPHALWTAEMKYDGQRAQVHAWRAGDHVNVKIYSRHLETMTDKVSRLTRALK
jgi:DNA ligase-1